MSVFSTSTVQVPACQLADCAAVNGRLQLFYLAFEEYVKAFFNQPILAAAQSRACDCSRSLGGIAVSNPARSMCVCVCLGNVVCCQVEVSASG
jgi:hypothetical protein